MDLDPVLLSRLQFAFVIAFHILLPAFTVGLSGFIVVLEGLYLWRRDPLHLRLSVFWTRIFAVSFGMGVVSGIVMPFQFGTNWSRFSDAGANVFGPLLAYEALVAFFLEAGFLGILLFGRKLVPPWVHFAAAAFVASGTIFSSFWILAMNSWMQTPVGHAVIDGRFFPADWVRIIFTPSFPYRLAHTVVGFFVTTGLVVAGVSAWHLKRRVHIDEARSALGMTLGLLGVLVPLQVVLGDLHGVNSVEHQPIKVAAMEGLWDTQARAPAVLFAIPDSNAETNRAEIAVPGLASLYLKHDIDATVQGLKSVPRDQRPPVLPVFFSFRIMVGMGLLMLALVVWAAILRMRRRLYETPAFLNACIVMLPAGFLAVVAGWTVTEVGRQPWLVYGLMRTRDGVSPTLATSDVMISFAIYIVVYLIVFGAGIFYMARLARAGPPVEVETRDAALGERPARPLSGARTEARLS
ncbi:MAG TPA: cytochrome ubiquinol oxidase subunit I [Casimicrobiaceae bacterium]|nr:cytochrome ubiquinol oxidase subunit I [Casimicrobiaceae bacterium]